MKISKIVKAGVMTAALSACMMPVAAQEINIDAANLSTPSYTKLLRLMATMQPATQPYSINMTVNGNPATQMAFAWFTNPTVKSGMVQIVAKANATVDDFATPTFTLNATSAAVNDLNYVTDKNKVEGIAANTKRSYTSHKALAKGLTPATTYSYRVGNENGWSEIGHFTTAATSYSKEDGFRFIYITDTQAQYDDMFDVSQKTVHAAQKMVPQANFVLVNGDLVETSGTNNSEWENEQWFSTMQDVWMNYPLVVAQGNHDTSVNSNFAWHFNTDRSFNETSVVKTDMEGTVYSFVQGDALFMVINYEDYKKEGYFQALADWMRKQVADNKDVKWRIATFHKNMFTGSGSHQSDSDGKLVREAMLPVFDELDIDVALQGHDHIYEVIGPVNNSNMTLAEGSVEHVETVVPGGVRENMTGKQGGVFNVANGTLYFLNNSAGKKKYEPRNEADMVKALAQHGVDNYWGLFSGKFGQTGEPTFSDVKVMADSIVVTTYTVNDGGTPSEFDSFKIIKDKKANSVKDAKAESVKILAADGSIEITGMQPERVEVYNLNGQVVTTGATAKISTEGWTAGVYVVKAAKGNDSYYGKVSVK